MTHICDICAYANQHGSWTDKIPGHTHCRTCHSTWTRTSEYQHCISCHRTFTNIRAADLHRDHNTCLDPTTAVDKKGRPRLARSTRRLTPTSTIELWARWTDPESAERLHRQDSRPS